MKNRSRTLSVVAVALAAMLVTPMVPQIVLVDGSGLDPAPSAQAAHYQAQNAHEDVQDAAGGGAEGIQEYADETIGETENTTWKTVGDAWNMIWYDILDPADDLAWEVVGHTWNATWALLGAAWQDAWEALGDAESAVWDYADNIEDSAWATAGNVEDYTWNTADRTEDSAWNLTGEAWDAMTQRYWDEHTAEEMAAELVTHWSDYVAREAGMDEGASEASHEAPPTPTKTTTSSNHESEDPDPVVIIFHGFRPPPPVEDWSMSGKAKFRNFLLDKRDQQADPDYHDVRRVSYYGGECDVEDDAAGAPYYTSDMDDYWRNSYGASHDSWFGGNEHSSHRGVDRECGLQVHDRDTDIRHLSYHMMWYIYSRYTENGIPVKVAASSMGGVLVRYGLAHAGNGVFPPELDIRDVVTVQSPHDGPASNWCGAGWGYRSVRQMCSDREHGFKWWNENYAQNPQGVNGTDWSLIGSFDDGKVPEDSAIAMDANWKYVYQDPDYDHTEPWSDTSSSNDATIWTPDGPWQGAPRGATLIWLGLISEWY